MDDLDDLVHEFVAESLENLDRLERELLHLEADPGAREPLAGVFRTIHTLKGTSAFLGFPKLEAVSHATEGLLVRLRDGDLMPTSQSTDALLGVVDVVRHLLGRIAQDGSEAGAVIDEVIATVTAIQQDVRPAGSAVMRGPQHEHASPPWGRRSAPHASVRVDVELLDALAQAVEELTRTSDDVTRRAGVHDDVGLSAAAERLHRVTEELQAAVARAHLQPVHQIWSKLHRVVRDLGAQCGRVVRLETQGADTELDRAVLEAIKDPLTHLVRNAVDHGLESPAERLAAGKPAVGTVTLRAYESDGDVVVEVSDDGAGIDVDRLASTAVRSGLFTADDLARMSPANVLHLVFVPGLSTAAAVTNISGRGVGMDVVRTNVEGVGGFIEVQSSPGRGTTCRLRLPAPGGTARAATSGERLSRTAS